MVLLQVLCINEKLGKWGEKNAILEKLRNSVHKFSFHICENIIGVLWPTAMWCSLPKQSLCVDIGYMGPIKIKTVSIDLISVREIIVTAGYAYFKHLKITDNGAQGASLHHSSPKGNSLIYADVIHEYLTKFVRFKGNVITFSI